jgi:hypothetical protein
MSLLRIAVSLSLILSARIASAQIIELPRTPVAGAVAANTDLCKVDFLARSGLDFFFEGPAQASVQILKLCLGEPTGFHLPLYLFVGPTGDAFGGVDPNETVAAGLVNPLGGTINASINQTHLLWGQQGKHTSIRMAYQGTFKLLSGKSLLDQNEGVLMPTGYADIGIRFQTAAWEPSDTKYGVAWIQGKFVGHLASETNLRDLLGFQAKNKFAGYSLDFGIQIDGKLNLKGGLYAADEPLVPLLEKPYWKFSFDYKAK